MAGRLEDIASVHELEVIAAAMREAFASGSTPGSPEIDRARAMANVFPGYEIVREIHRGGQGVVYQALQKSTQRQVAIKVMRDGPFANPSDRTRFEREVQVLAQLDHPNVVAIHDSGVAHDRFYYVMDYIHGRPLDEFVSEEDPPIDDLLRLFQNIAEAVNAAHLRGVTHRDLKPSNILVVNGNGETTERQRVNAYSALPKGVYPDAHRGTPHSPLPKILDFGLAKLAPSTSAAQGGDDSGDQTLPVMTISGQFVGSLPWASPEQAEGAVGKIDLRTDVYSLGVMLYQLLTGRFPYPVVGAMRDVVDHILKVEPARPSTIRRQINDEIETIVLKCLAKERDRRYQSAGDLARDIGRYLGGEPIEAKRDSGWYVIKKTLGRHKGPVIFGAASLVMLLATIVTVAVMWQRSAAAERRAVAGERRAVQAKDVALGILEGDFLKRLARGEADARRVLDDVARQSESEFDDPMLAIVVNGALGKGFFAVGAYTDAEKHLRAELALRRQLQPVEDQDLLSLVESLNSLGECLREKGESPEGEGPNDFQVAAELHHEALELARERFGEDHLETARSLHDLGAAHWWLKEYAIARPLYERALEVRKRFGEETAATADSYTHLAACMRKQGEYVQAEAHYRRALAIREGLSSRVPFDAAVAQNNLAMCLLDQQRHAEAESLFRKARETMRDQVRDGHPFVTRVLHNLARCLGEMGDLAQASEVLTEALAKKRNQLSPRALSTAHTLCELAKVKRAQGLTTEAEALCREALDIQGDVADSAESRYVLGAILADSGRFEEAEPLLLRGFERLQAQLGSSHRNTIAALRQLIELYEDWGKPSEAEAYRALLPDEDDQ